MNLLRCAAAVASLSLLACGPSERRSQDPDAEESAVARRPQALTLPEVTLRFNADWTVTQSGPLVAGATVRFSYDVARLPGCRGDFNGQPAWTISGYHQLESG